ncbi:hypothetical protein AGMMS49521_0510 [Campylobacterota bacterium]|nr:hypothetical protein AGMMS49521_0510 [Campylobacterota bacterium]
MVEGLAWCSFVLHSPRPILLRLYVKHETNALYMQGIDELERIGYKVKAVVAEGVGVGEAVRSNKSQRLIFA